MKDGAKKRGMTTGVERQVGEAVDKLSEEARKLKQLSELMALQSNDRKVSIDAETLRALHEDESQSRNTDRA